MATATPLLTPIPNFEGAELLCLAPNARPQRRSAYELYFAVTDFILQPQSDVLEK
jgi:hypothetical protein